MLINEQTGNEGEAYARGKDWEKRNTLVALKEKYKGTDLLVKTPELWSAHPCYIRPMTPEALRPLRHISRALCARVSARRWGRPSALEIVKTTACDTVYRHQQTQMSVLRLLPVERKAGGGGAKPPKRV